MPVLSFIINLILNLITTGLLLGVVLVIGWLLGVKVDPFWFRPEEAEVRTEITTTAALWWRSVGIWRRRFWLVLLPFALGGLTLLSVARPQHKAVIPHVVHSPSALKKYENVLKWVGFAVVGLCQGTALGGIVGEPLSSGNDWSVAALLAISGAWLLGNRKRGKFWFLWVAVAVASLAQVWLSKYCTMAQTHRMGWADIAIYLGTSPPVTALTGAVILLVLRNLQAGQPAFTKEILAEEVWRVWPAWCVLDFVRFIPLTLSLALPRVSLSSHSDPSSIIVRSALLLAVMFLSSVMVFVLSLALRFAPYALVTGETSALGAVKRSVGLLCHRTGEVVRLLGPLAILGILWTTLTHGVFDLDIAKHPNGGDAWFLFLQSSLFSTFMLLAELTCLQWYQLNATTEEAQCSNRS